MNTVLHSLILTWCGAMISVTATEARACGCFTPPNPTVPVVQAGENILFAVADSIVTAHIQIQYQGKASDFGWLLPLPSLPTLTLGTDELFTQLAITQPSYGVTYVYPTDSCPQSNPGNPDLSYNFGGADYDAGDKNGGGLNPLVIQSSIGPYDFAVLKADDQTAMLGWLGDNHYFVPVGTTDTVAPYVHTGAYFLALKLKSGQSAGAIQPVVVQYASDLPMIPILLTSVGATPNMGIHVWVLGASRAIPRNYEHTVLNDAAIDWLEGGANYNDVVIAATKEALNRHTFVTEFAGASSIMAGVLDPPGRFGTANAMYAISDAGAYLDYLANNGYVFGSALVAILSTYLPEPAALAAHGISAANFYFNGDYYLGTYRQLNPDQFSDWTGVYDPKMLTDDIETNVVAPVIAANMLFTSFPYLTRLYTTLSPADMTADPVFSFNPSLPDVSNIHNATLTLTCSESSYSGYDGQLRTEEGFGYNVPGGFSTPTLPTMPASLRIEILREAGAPQVQVDNTQAIELALTPISGPGSGTPAISGGGCRVEPNHGNRSTLIMLALALIVMGLMLRRVRKTI